MAGELGGGGLREEGKNQRIGQNKRLTCGVGTGGDGNEKPAAIDATPPRDEREKPKGGTQKKRLKGQVETKRRKKIHYGEVRLSYE